MKSSIALWVQSDKIDSPDLLSVGGERITPDQGDTWSAYSSSLFDIKTYGINLFSNDDFSLFNKGDKFIVKGTLSQVDVHGRYRVFIANVYTSSTGDLFKLLREELKHYGFTLSNACEDGISKFIRKTNLWRIGIFGLLTLLLIVLLLYVI